MSNKLKPIEQIFSSSEERERIFDEYFERYRRSPDLSINPIDPHEWIQKLPKQLYKYRTSKDYDIAAFENGDLWFSHPVVWDDDTDASVRFETIEDISKKIGTDFREYAIRSFGPIIKNSVPCERRNILDEFSIRRYVRMMVDSKGDVNKGRTKALLLSLGMKRDQTVEYTERLAASGKNFANGRVFREGKKCFNEIKDRADGIRKDNYMASLCENGASDYMWRDYSMNGDGFLVCYSFDFVDDQSGAMIGATCPMMYGIPKKFDFSSIPKELLAVELLKQGEKGRERIIKDKSETIVRSIYTKNPKYEYEQEWRITFSPNDAEKLGVRKSSGGGLFHFPYAKKVILGWNLNQEKKERIIAAAKKQNCEIEFKEPPNTKRVK